MDQSQTIFNFMSYNSTGLDCFKASWINDLIKTFNIDFLQIQEHFKASKNIDQYFKKVFPLNHPYIIPGHREPFQEGGRAKGGLAQLVKKVLDVKIEKNSYK